MAAAVPQPQAPPMAHLSRDGSDRASAIASAILLKQQNAASNGPSPFSTTSSPRTDSPTSPSLDSHRALGMTVSEKSSFSSTSSAPASPASLSYSPAVQSALRDSCRSSISSHNSSQAFPQSSHHKSQKDIEKQQSPKRSNNEIPSDRSTTAHYHASSYGAPEPEYEQEDTNAENKVISILLYLSGPNCLVSMVILLYTIFALFATILLQPFRLCTSGSSFRQQMIGFLAPTLRIQLNFIHSAYTSDEYSAPMLVVVNLFSPILSLGVAGAAWVAAAFWFFNTILGDPDGSDKPKGYNDGRASVMGVRKWWEKWLRRPLR